MTDTTAPFYGARSSNRRRAARGDSRRVVRSAVIGLGALATASALVTLVSYTAAWIANTAFSSNPRIQALASTGPRALSLAGSYRVAAIAEKQAAATDASFEARWMSARLPASASASAVPLLAQPAVAVAANVPLPSPRPIIPVQVAQADEPVGDVPLPRPHPAKPEIAQASVAPAAPKVAMASSPPTAPREPAPQDHDKLAALPGREGRTAVYDIAAHTVYLPNGQKLEAHSGLGDKLDDPRYVSVRMRGPTPPNVYDLTLREASFHGVQAIRLNPVDDDKMFGRDGMLAHTYMLGGNGQSNGCVSFKDYSKFLRAYLNGDVDRLVVVARLGNTPVHVARRAQADRYALNNQ
jgi:Tlde1 domain